MALSSKNETIALKSLSSVRRVEDKFIRGLAKTMHGLEVSLFQFVEENKGLRAVDVALAREQIGNILVESGYYDEVGNLLNAGYQDVIEESAIMYRKLYSKSFQFTDVSLQRLDAMKQLDLGQFGQLASQTQESVTRVLTDLQFGAIEFREASKIVAGQVGALESNAQTWVTTGNSAIHREANTMLAMDNGMTIFEYVGPVDKVTRPFCLAHVGDAMSKDEWNALDNGRGQPKPVFQFGGGYNCRHTLVGIE